MMYVELLKARQVMLTKRAVCTGVMIAREGRVDLQGEFDRVLGEIGDIIARIAWVESCIKTT